MSTFNGRGELVFLWNLEEDNKGANIGTYSVDDEKFRDFTLDILNFYVNFHFLISGGDWKNTLFEEKCELLEIENSHIQQRFYK